MSKNEINKGAEVTLRDGQKVELKPLTIKQLRRFVKLADKFDTATEELTDDALDAMIDACAIALEKVAPKLSEDKDYLEDNLDIPSMNTILGVAMGGDGNPN